MPLDQERWREEHRAGFLSMGGPILVPGGRRFPRWKLGGYSRDRDREVYSVEATAHNRGGVRIEVRTSLDGPDSLASVVGPLLLLLVPPDVSLPYTGTVAEREITARLAPRSALPLRLLYTDTQWTAVGAFGDRWVHVRG